MKRSRFSEEQVAYALRQVEAGTPVGDVCRQLGVSEATFYAWKKKYAHLGVSELRHLRQLEDENGRLKRPNSSKCRRVIRRPFPGPVQRPYSGAGARAWGSPLLLGEAVAPCD